MSNEMMIDTEKLTTVDLDSVRALNTMLTSLLIGMVKTTNIQMNRDQLAPVVFRMDRNILDYNIKLEPVIDKEHNELGMRVILIMADKVH